MRIHLVIRAGFGSAACEDLPSFLLTDVWLSAIYLKSMREQKNAPSDKLTPLPVEFYPSINHPDQLVAFAEVGMFGKVYAYGRSREEAVRRLARVVEFHVDTQVECDAYAAGETHYVGPVARS